ncbi:hypothetical protein LINPERPRIM_LOCUS36612 [Linum perenne]
MIEPGLSSRIIKEALIQQREIQEEAEERNPDREAFAAAEDELAKLIEEDDDEADFDDFAGFSETQSRFGDFEVLTKPLRFLNCVSLPAFILCL